MLEPSKEEITCFAEVFINKFQEAWQSIKTKKISFEIPDSFLLLSQDEFNNILTKQGIDISKDYTILNHSRKAGVLVVEQIINNEHIEVAKDFIFFANVKEAIKNIGNKKELQRIGLTYKINLADISIMRQDVVADIININVKRLIKVLTDNDFILGQVLDIGWTYESFDNTLVFLIQQIRILKKHIINREWIDAPINIDFPFLINDNNNNNKYPIPNVDPVNTESVRGFINYTNNTPLQISNGNIENKNIEEEPNRLLTDKKLLTTLLNEL